MIPLFISKKPMEQTKEKYLLSLLDKWWRKNAWFAMRFMKTNPSDIYRMRHDKKTLSKKNKENIISSADDLIDDLTVLVETMSDDS